MEILNLLAEGLTNKQIGIKLNISVKTVEKQRDWLHTHLGVHNIVQLLRKAFQVGLLNYETWVLNQPSPTPQTPPKPAPPNSQQNRFDPTSLGLSI